MTALQAIDISNTLKSRKRSRPSLETADARDLSAMLPADTGSLTTAAASNEVGSAASGGQVSSIPGNHPFPGFSGYAAMPYYGHAFYPMAFSATASGTGMTLAAGNGAPTGHLNQQHASSDEMLAKNMTATHAHGHDDSAKSGLDTKCGSSNSSANNSAYPLLPPFAFAQHPLLPGSAGANSLAGSSQNVNQSMESQATHQVTAIAVQGANQEAVTMFPWPLLAVPQLAQQAVPTPSSTANDITQRKGDHTQVLTSSSVTESVMMHEEEQHNAMQESMTDTQTKLVQSIHTTNEPLESAANGNRRARRQS